MSEPQNRCFFHRSLTEILRLSLLQQIYFHWIHFPPLYETQRLSSKIYSLKCFFMNSLNCLFHNSQVTLIPNIKYEPCQTPVFKRGFEVCGPAISSVELQFYFSISFFSRFSSLLQWNTGCRCRHASASPLSAPGHPRLEPENIRSLSTQLVRNWGDCTDVL